LDYALAVKNSPAPISREQTLQRAYLMGTAWEREAFAKVRALLRDFYACRRGYAMCLVTESQEPHTMRVLPRGNWQDESGPVVEPAAPTFLAGTPVADAPGSPRLTWLDLANWLISPENPLTARVFVNR